MDYLTVKEVAELKGCSERYVQRLCKSGKIEFALYIDANNQQQSYSIPISTLPDELQQRYYKQQRSDAGLLPEVKEKAKPAARKQRAFEDLTADERAEVNVWTEILKEWQGLRNGYNGSKVEFDKLYIGKCQLEHPDIKVSKDI
ncbi:MAG: helix-turn-helix domain-containing protein, partial [Ruminococcus sp.]|nr:helix-turn-helix domain-containing protein [Ruminococcus sp.]